MAPLTVLLPPSIVVQPQSQTVRAGSNVTFSVSATGSPPLEYQWQFQGGDISDATASSYVRSAVTPEDAGNYAVRISNAAGELLSSNAVLTIILTPPQIAAVGLSGSDQLSLLVTGDAGTSVTLWRSEDLVGWEAVTNVVNSTGTVEFTEPVDTGVGQRFYRVAWP